MYSKQLKADLDYKNLLSSSDSFTTAWDGSMIIWNFKFDSKTLKQFNLFENSYMSFDNKVRMEKWLTCISELVW